ncbi:hydroxyethylthiazole kinase [Rhodovulum adriaticum]|uniref:Hydroxyethylthiazole kinase n=1 Tax=Rhodovulum adriaticum TaxID=35804 RepID=A0A4R2NLI0_RHOAD|nr:hydroxyethylthiazole kinase [Rhodovulum adriaticum]MBK1635179.1 hydroxyethylthiazole kinase [Rhodovulum adriaticum]TCP22292.1 hydroxyethylthiazole kinase [Rhodovulum adriaticum]
MTDWGSHLSTMRAQAPLVLNITNFVAMNVMANVLLAVGASPAMAHAEEEIAEITALSGALTINFGTADASWMRGIFKAVETAQARDIPWVFDPVAVAVSQLRRDTAARLLEMGPAVVRGNASEILAMAGQGDGGKGVDATDGVAEAEAAARSLANRSGAVVAVTGPVDFVTDGDRAYRVAGGHPLMPQVTALGCALTGVVGAFLPGQPRLEGTAAALACYATAGERAGAGAAGPGSFAVAFLDALAALTPADLTAAARVTPA